MNTRVLVIEDSNVVRQTVERSLAGAGYSVVAARDGSEGMQRWREAPPDLVITDIMMPQRDGIETIMEIRRLSPHAKILAMTGFRHTGSVDFSEMLRNLGADDVLTKPFASEALLAKVESMLERAPVRLAEKNAA